MFSICGIKVEEYVIFLYEESMYTLYEYIMFKQDV